MRHPALEPLGREDPGVVAHGDFQNPSFPVTAERAVRNGGHDRLDPVRLQLVNFPDFPAIFIGSGQKIKQIFDGLDFFCRKPFSHFRPDALQKLHRRGQLFRGDFQVFHAGGNLLFLQIARIARVKVVGGVLEPFQDERGFGNAAFLLLEVLAVVFLKNSHHVVQGGAENVFRGGRNGRYLQSDQAREGFPQVPDVREIFKLIFSGKIQRLLDALKILFKRLHFIMLRIRKVRKMRL